MGRGPSRVRVRGARAGGGAGWTGGGASPSSPRLREGYDLIAGTVFLPRQTRCVLELELEQHVLMGREACYRQAAISPTPVMQGRGSA